MEIVTSKGGKGKTVQGDNDDNIELQMSELKWGGQKVVRRSQSAPLATHSPHLLAHGEGGCDDHHGECDLEGKWKSS